MLEKLDKINWRKEVRNRRYLLWAVVCLGMVLLLLWLVVVAQATQAFSLQTQISESEEMLTRLRKKSATLDQARSLPIYRYQHKISQVLPSKKPVFELLSSLEAVSGRANVEITEIKLAPGLVATQSAEARPSKSKKSKKMPVQNKSGVDEFKVELTISGSFKAINRFFSLINEIAPLTSVTQTEINMRGGLLSRLNSDEKFTATVELETYFFTREIKATVDTPLPEMTGQEEGVLVQLDSFTLPGLTQPSAVIGGGLEDLFGVDTLKMLKDIAQEEEELEELAPPSQLNLVE